MCEYFFACEKLAHTHVKKKNNQPAGFSRSHVGGGKFTCEKAHANENLCMRVFSVHMRFVFYTCEQKNIQFHSSTSESHARNLLTDAFWTFHMRKNTFTCVKKNAHAFKNACAFFFTHAFSPPLLMNDRGHWKDLRLRLSWSCCDFHCT